MGDIADLLFAPLKPKSSGGGRGASGFADIFGTPKPKSSGGGGGGHHASGGLSDIFGIPNRGNGGGGRQGDALVARASRPAGASSTPSASYATQRTPGRTLQSFTGNFYRAPTKKELPKRPDVVNYSTYGSTVQEAPGPDVDDLQKLLQKDNLEKRDRDLLIEEDKNYGKRHTYRMTRQAFSQLDEDQQAAVRFNTLLIHAREKDIKLQDKYSPDNEQKAQYDEQVRHMFGAGHGSRTYAPETLGVLSSIDFAKVGDDLDDYLGLKTAITDDDLRGMRDKNNRAHLVTTAFEAATPERARVSLGESLAAKLAAYREGMARKGHLMTSFPKSAALERNDELIKIGGEVNHVKPEMGFGQNSDRAERNQDVDALLQNSYTDLGLKHPGTRDEKTLGLLGRVDALSPLDVNDKLMRYADTKTRLAQEFNLPINVKADKAGHKMKTPEEYRRYLGLSTQIGDE